jgi:hypothetical protein
MRREKARASDELMSPLLAESDIDVGSNVGVVKFLSSG